MLPEHDEVVQMQLLKKKFYQKVAILIFKMRMETIYARDNLLIYASWNGNLKRQKYYSYSLIRNNDSWTVYYNIYNNIINYLHIFFNLMVL